MKDTDVFEGKNFSDLLKDIHDNAVVKRSSINNVITQLVGMMKTQDDAIVLAPIIREFIDVGVKNDDQVIKVATIVQRMVTAQSYGNANDGVLLSDAEKEQLIRNAIDVDQQIEEIESKLEDRRGQNS
jgi:uncharacterized protein YbcV (DUF1398 family)